MNVMRKITELRLDDDSELDWISEISDYESSDEEYIS